MNLGLVPLRNFADLGEGLFRSAQPMYGYEYRWLRNVAGVDMIINLRAESDHDLKMASDHGMEVYTIPVIDHHEPTKSQAKIFMQLVKAAIQSGKKILFHCEHGHGRTSTFCVLARLAQGWTLDEALKEEENFHYEFKHHAQIEFLMDFQPA
jgi:protein-tyrosine phosphatase